LVTVRHWAQRNASASSVAGVGTGGPGGQEPGQRRHVGLGVDPLVVDVFDPGGEQVVELSQAGHAGPGAEGAAADLDQELVPDGAEEPFDFASASWLSGSGVGELDPEDRAGPAQPGVDEAGPVVDVALGGSPA
jgi:hypothetical protein